MIRIYDPNEPRSASGGYVATEQPAPSLLDQLDELAARLKAKPDAEVGAALRQVIHSRAVAVLVRTSPTPVDDAVLVLLREMFPAA